MATGDDLSLELWKACAGPLVDFPRVGDLVYYFPQGHLEQFEVSTDHESNQPVFNLPSKILCRVMDVQLLAEQDTDGVFAQIKLVREADQTEPTSINFHRAELSRATVHSFYKVLTASAVGKRYELYVPSKYASKCLPPLEMSQKTPEKWLVAKDLHGIEWKFKHIIRGKPPRHMLTTGWSAFVTSKRLVAGDIFGFLREGGELRIGVNRLSCPKSSFPSSEAPFHAPLVGPAFVVNCKPRLSQFIITLNKYTEALSKKFSIGMRIKIPFEVEDSVKKGFTGTIVGIGDICGRKWPNSEWRCLKVQWDGPPSIRRPENVSPWEIEALGEKLSSNVMPLSVLPNGKRKLHKEPQELVESLDTVVRTGPHHMRASVEDRGERLHYRCPTTTEGYIELDHQKGIWRQNDTAANLREEATIHGTHVSRGSLADPLSANLFQDETQPQPQGIFINQVPIGEISGKDPFRHIDNLDIPQTVSPDNTLVSNGSNTWLNLLQGVGLEALEPEKGTSSHLQPFPEDADHMPLEETRPLASQPVYCNMIYVPSPTSLIPYNGPGRGDELVPWERFWVARRCISVLNRIKTRYPELLASFRVTSKDFQSMSLEIVAGVVYMLEHLRVGSTSPEQLAATKQYLNDLKMIGIEVDWIEKRLLQIDAVIKKDTLVKRQEELSPEVVLAKSKFRQLKGELELVQKELEEVTSKIGTDPLSADQYLMEGLL